MEGVHEDVVLKDEEHMKEVNEMSEKLENGSCSQSILNDVNNEEMIFSEESSRVIHEMENMEPFELRQTRDAIQCHSCLKYVTKGQFCECGVRLHPDDDKISTIKARFAKVNRSKKAKSMETTIGRPWTPKEERRSAIIPLYWNDCKRMRNTEFLKWQLFGRKCIAVIWTISRRLTSAMKLLILKEVATKARSMCRVLT